MSQENQQYVSRAGNFLARVKPPGNGWFGESGEDAKPFIRVPVFVAEDGDQDGKEIVWRGYLTDAAFDRTIDTLVKAFPEWDGSLESLSSGSFTFAGKECRIVVEAETYNGERRFKAKWLNPVNGGGKGMEADKVSSLVSRLNRKAMAIAKASRDGGGASRPAPRASAPVAETNLDGDDIPF